MMGTILRGRTSFVIAGVLSIGGWLLAVPLAQAESPSGPPERVSVLVKLAHGADRAEPRAFAARHGGVVRFEYRNVLRDVINIRNLPLPAVAALERLPAVEWVRDDYEVELKLQDSIPLIRGLPAQLAAAGHSATGQGVRVCIIDTGIDPTHTMFTGRIDHAASYDFFNNDADATDDHGHGTHVAGIAAGAGSTVDFGCYGPEPFQGVAPEATLIGVKVLNAFGMSTVSTIIAGIDHCADPALPGGQADVINMSLGTGFFVDPCDSDPWANASNDAVDAGVTVVVAAGNEANTNGLATPACATKSIAVGATWDDPFPTCEDARSQFVFSSCTETNPVTDQVTCFSNRSDHLDVTAPGCLTHSALADPDPPVTEGADLTAGSEITDACGTSMASPHVAGLAALVLEVNPLLAPAQVRQAIRDGAVDLGAAGFDRGYGHGRIDVVETLDALAQGCSTAAECDDADPCTSDDCLNNYCLNTPLDCDDADACTADSCSGGLCANDPLDCDDADPCTTDSCDPATGCANDPVSCPPGEVCVGGVCEPAGCDGDGVCEAGEDCVDCSSDCFTGSGASCGNGVCEIGDGEDCLSCAADCNGKQGGKPANRYCCGDGAGDNPVGCGDARCTSGGLSCTDLPALPSCCGDGICEGAEDGFNCEIDCGPPPCGDGTCAVDEDSCSCPADCGAPPPVESDCGDGIDEDCDGPADCADADCSADPLCACGNPGDACVTGADCCSSRCKRNGTCR